MEVSRALSGLGGDKARNSMVSNAMLTKFMEFYEE